MNITSPRRSGRTTPSKYKSLPAAPNEMSKPTSSSALISEVPGKEGTPDVQVDSDIEATPKKRSRVALKFDTDEEEEGEEHPSSTVKSGGSPPAHRHRRGLRDLKVVGTISNKWTSDEDDDDSDELPTIGTWLHY